MRNSGFIFGLYGLYSSVEELSFYKLSLFLVTSGGRVALFFYNFEMVRSRCMTKLFSMTLELILLKLVAHLDLIPFFSGGLYTSVWCFCTTVLFRVCALIGKALLGNFII